MWTNKTITKQPKLGIISLMLNPCASKRLCRRNDEVVCVCACMCVVCMHVHVRVCVCACVCVFRRVWEDRMDETGRQRGKHSLDGKAGVPVPTLLLFPLLGPWLWHCSVPPPTTVWCFPISCSNVALPKALPQSPSWKTLLYSQRTLTTQRAHKDTTHFQGAHR